MYNSALLSGGCFRRFRKWPKRLVLGRFKFSLENAYVCAKIFSPCYLLEFTLHPPRNYSRVHVYLLSYSRAITLQSTCIYIRTLHCFLNREIESSSRWQFNFSSMSMIQLPNVNRRGYVYKYNGIDANSGNSPHVGTDPVSVRYPVRQGRHKYQTTEKARNMLCGR